QAANVKIGVRPAILRLRVSAANAASHVPNLRSGCQHKAWGGAKRNPRNSSNRNEKGCRAGVRPAILRFSIGGQLLVGSHGHVGREFRLRPFSAVSILTFRKQNRAACFHYFGGANAAEDTTNKTYAVNNCAGEWS